MWCAEGRMATVYRRAWGPLVAAVLLIGVAVACTCIGGGVVVFCALIGLLCAAVPFERWCADHGFDRGELRVIGGALCGTALLGLIGLAVAAGAFGWWMGVVLVSASWPILRRPHAPAAAIRSPVQAGHADAGCGPTEERIASPALPVPATVSTLSMMELCWTWRVSFVRLQHASCAPDREVLARLRAALLAELERRDPAGFACWLPTARAASDPARFFQIPDRSTPPSPGGAADHRIAGEAGSG